MRNIEILAPAGSVSSLKGAIAAGCDAVYIGGGKFGARAYADNPDTDELVSAIDFVHLNGKKIYLTTNTLLKNNELEKQFYNYFKPLYEAGLDACIVQDTGVLKFIQRNFPDIPIHLSTQTTICSGLGAKLLEKEKGVTRVVPARELTLPEIKELRKDTNLEIECFVHGALCYSFSGQCLLSSMIGGRSGNRGRCAQPCRKQYELFSDDRIIKDGYLISLKDLCTLDSIPDLIDAGIDSFKIEGRMKKPEYTAGVASAYAFLARLYTEKGRAGYEKYIKSHPEELAERIREAGELYNRGGFTNGYYFNYHGPQMMFPDRPNHSGVEIGKVSCVSGRHISIKTEIELNPQDVLEIRGKSDSFEFTVGIGGIERMGSSGIYDINVSPDLKIVKGLPVYRIKNERLIQSLNDKYLKEDSKGLLRGTLSANVGERLTLILEYGNIKYTQAGDIVESAKSKPMLSEDFKNILNKTGESEFAFDSLSVVCSDNAFVPVGKIKEIRRNAFAGIKNELLEMLRRKAPVCKELVLNDTPFEVLEQEIIVRVSDKEQLKAVLSDTGFCDTIYLDMQMLPLSEQITEYTKIKDKKVFLCFPPVFRKKEADRYLEELNNADIKRFVVNSFDEIQFVKENIPDAEMAGSEQLYVMNEEAREKISESFGVKRTSVSLELNESELEGINLNECNLLIYGRVPVMYTAQCLMDNYPGCLKKGSVNKNGLISIKDRTGAQFPVKTLCRSCMNIIYNSSIYSLVGMRELERLKAFKGYVFSFTFENYDETLEVIRAYKCNEDLKGNYTRGHMRRGVE